MKIYFVVLLLTIRGGFFSSERFQGLQKLLSHNDTIEWLKTMEIHNETSPYCNLCCINITDHTIGKHCGSHTLCKFSRSEVGPGCKGYVNVRFTTAEKLALLDSHNTLRMQVAKGLESRGNPGPQPIASNMRQLQWNGELALIAERWAAQCIFAHDKCRDTERFPIGQNLARGNLATNNELSLIDDWYNEVIYFNNSEVPGYKMPKQSTHPAHSYTQLMWADTYQIGCARAIFQQSQDSKVVYKEHLVCNYGPTGNIPNQPVYKIGVPCSSCPEGTDCSQDYDGLCEHNFGDVNIKMDTAQHLYSSSILHKCSIFLMLLIYFFYCVYLYIVH